MDPFQAHNHADEPGFVRQPIESLKAPQFAKRSDGKTKPSSSNVRDLEKLNNILSNTLSFSDISREESLISLQKVLKALPSADRTGFLDYTLPELIRRKNNRLSSNLIKNIKTSSSEGSLAVAVPCLLKAMIPTEPLSFDSSGSFIFERLRSLKELLREQHKEFFKTGITTLFGKQVPSQRESYDALREFEVFCKKNREHALDFVTHVASSFDPKVTPGISLSQLIVSWSSLEAPPKHNIEGFFKFISDVLPLHKHEEVDILILMSELAPVWSKWGEDRCIDIVKNLGTIFSQLIDPCANSTAAAILKVSYKDGQLASMLIESSLEIVKKHKGNDLEIKNYFERLDRTLNLLAYHSAEETINFVRATALQGIDRLADQLVEKLLGTFPTDAIGRVSHHMPFLMHALTNYFDSAQLQELDQCVQSADEPPYGFGEKLAALKHGLEEKSPINYILARLYATGAYAEHPFPISNTDYDNRWEKYAGRTFEPAFTIPENLWFKTNITPRDATLIVDDTLNNNFVKNQINKYMIMPPNSLLTERIYKTLAKLAHHRPYQFPPSMLPSESLSLLFEIANREGSENDAKFEQAVHIILPLLPKATDYRFNIPAAPDELRTQQRFLNSLFLLLDSHMPELFRRKLNCSAENTEKRIKQFKNVSQTHSIAREKSKFHFNSKSDRVKVALRSNMHLTFTDFLYDLACESCIIYKCGMDLPSKIFRPVFIVLPAQSDVIGCCYVNKMNVFGKPSLVLNGGIIRHWFNQVVDRQSFISNLLDLFREIALENDATGGIYQAIGPRIGTDRFTQRPRIAQADEMVDLLVGKRPKIQELPEQEQVYMPQGYLDKDTKEPIALRYVHPLIPVLPEELVV